MVELTDEQITAANERGRIVRATQPHARAARYDATTDRVIVDLTNGASFAFPPRLVEGLHDAAPAEIAEVEVRRRNRPMSVSEIAKEEIKNE